MRLKRKLVISVGSLMLGLIFLILINSSLGTDRDETFTDLHRPEIVGESASERP